MVWVALAFAYRAHRAEEQRLIEREQAEIRLHDEQDRARARLLEEKNRNAYQIATTGDLKRTDKAIKEIEALGASTGQVRLLRGTVAYYRNDAEAAISELEQAVQLLPESVAARALLAMSYTDYGQFQRFEQLIMEMEHLTPSSPEDYLFKGYARQMNEPGLGLADLDEGIRRRDSPLGRALRAIVRTFRAIDSAERQYAEDALSDANAARGMLPDNPLVLYASLYARLVAAGIYKDAKLAERRREVLLEAAKDVQALEPFIELPNPAWIMWLYFEEIEDTGKALDVARRSLVRSKTPMAAFYCVVSLYGQGRFSEAVECLDQRRRADMPGDVARAFVLAELPDGPRLALEECNQLAIKYPQDGWELLFRSDALLLLGRKEQALATRQRFRAPLALSQDWKEFYEAMRGFGCGELSEDTYLAKAGASRWKQCLAHYGTGLSRLAEADRSGARKHFQEAVGTRATWSYYWGFSCMFLSRLDSDPKWPPWIPVKK
jgi:tetratricopeptide (TPR) repeat protein